MTTENSKGMKDVGTSNVSHVSRNSHNAYRLQLRTQVALSKSHSEAITTMLMICFLIQHGFLPVFAMVGKIMSYSNCLLYQNQFCQSVRPQVDFVCPIMYQSIPSVTIPPGDPGAFDQNFCPRTGICLGQGI